MRRIAVINQKGGVGKTTTVANIGAAVADAGRRVLLVDLDPQAHLTLHLGVELGADQPSVYELLTDSSAAADVVVAARANLGVLPACTALAAADVELATVVGREVILRDALDALAGDYDVALIDCPPALGVLTINALAAATEVVIPLQPHFFALQGITKLFETAALVRRRINPALTVSGIALCMHEPSTRLATEVVEDLERYLAGARGTDVAWASARVYRTFVRRNIKLAEASSYGRTVFEYAPRSHGAMDYADLAAEVFPEVGVARVVAAGHREDDASVAEAPAPGRVDGSAVGATRMDGLGAGLSDADAGGVEASSIDTPDVATCDVEGTVATAAGSTGSGPSACGEGDASGDHFGAGVIPPVGAPARTPAAPMVEARVAADTDPRGGGAADAAVTAAAASGGASAGNGDGSAAAQVAEGCEVGWWCSGGGTASIPVSRRLVVLRDVPVVSADDRRGGPGLSAAVDARAAGEPAGACGDAVPVAGDARDGVAVARPSTRVV
ncbi:MAG: ParA family protein [Phycisphaerae bacterium]